MKTMIIRDLFKDEKWSRYQLYKDGADGFGIIDRNNSYYKCFDEFEEYFKGDFITPYTYKIEIKEEYNQIIKHVKINNNKLGVILYYSK